MPSRRNFSFILLYRDILEEPRLSVPVQAADVRAYSRVIYCKRMQVLYDTNDVQLCDDAAPGRYDIDPRGKTRLTRGRFYLAKVYRLGPSLISHYITQARIGLCSSIDRSIVDVSIVQLGWSSNDSVALRVRALPCFASLFLHWSRYYMLVRYLYVLDIIGHSVTLNGSR